MVSNIVLFDEIRSIAIASITPSYTPLGFLTSPATPAPFTHAMRVLHFVNDSNGVYLISFDSVTDNVVLPGNSFSLYDLTSDEDHNEAFRYQVGTQLYIKSLVTPSAQTGTSNTVYVVAIYGKGE